MNAATIIAILAIAAILYFAVRYIYKEKKKGTACIGCPYAADCPKRRQSPDGCCTPPDDKQKERDSASLYGS